MTAAPLPALPSAAAVAGHGKGAAAALAAAVTAALVAAIQGAASRVAAPWRKGGRGDVLPAPARAAAPGTAPPARGQQQLQGDDARCAPAPAAPLSAAAARRVRDNATAAAAAFGYVADLRRLSPVVRGRRVLDVGAGRGPATGVAVLALGAAAYVGVDPRQCPARRMPTRDRAGGYRRRGRRRVADFPFAAAELARAYGPRLSLLRGTVEAREGALAALRHDVVLIHAKVAADT
eukprot:gene25838-14752_t